MICPHNIIQTHNSVPWDWCIMRNILHIQDWQYFVEYYVYSIWMWRIFRKLLLVPLNTTMDLNNVMFQTAPRTMLYSRWSVTWKLEGEFVGAIQNLRKKLNKNSRRHRMTFNYLEYRTLLKILGHRATPTPTSQ
jgi:hypothetical protein